MVPVSRVMSLLLVAGAGVAACVPDPIIAGHPDAGAPQQDSGPPPVTGKTADQLTREWSGCMTLDNFNLANMATAWGNLAATNGQACSSCHGTGLEGFLVDRDASTMFTAISTMKGFLLMYFSPDVTNQKMIVNESIFQAVAAGQGGFAGHPPFEPKNNAGMTALRSFYNVTYTRQQANMCDPPRIP